MLHGVIMAGGSGTRFWPASRRSVPKHLLKLTGEHSLLQEAVKRLMGLVPADRVMVVTNKDQAALTAEQLGALPPEAIVAEPCARDTAACVGLAATLLGAADPDAVLLTSPADHEIRPAESFQLAVKVAADLVAQHPTSFVTFGIRPTFPATGYGYIHRGEPRQEIDGVAVYRVLDFREKPDRRRAGAYMKKGEYYWNSGIFVWRADAILASIREHAPVLGEALGRIAEAVGTPEADAVIAREYEGLERISIDYAVMEHAKEVFVVEAPFEWDDVGSWSALARLRGDDEQGNTVVGKHGGRGTQGSIIFSDDEHLVATLGVTDLIIVHSKDATLVANRRDDEAIKRLVDWLEKHGFEGHL